MLLTSKRAIMFIGSKRGKEARFTSCSGYIRRIVKYDESKAYQFTFDTELSNGNVSVEMLNSNKERVLFLKQSGSVVVPLETGKRYYLMIRFEAATGSYNLNWR